MSRENLRNRLDDVTESICELVSTGEENDLAIVVVGIAAALSFAFAVGVRLELLTDGKLDGLAENLLRDYENQLKSMRDKTDEEVQAWMRTH